MTFWHKSKTFMGLALPMIITNIFTPLAGMVDTAIVGHLPGSHFLAGVALGGLLITQVIWVAGFLRMSVTGLSAQAYGKQQNEEAAHTIQNGVFLALGIGILLMVLQEYIFSIGSHFSSGSELMLEAAQDYFQVRINLVFIPLLNLVLSGWMLGRQWHRLVMKIQLIASLINLLLSWLLAVQLGFGVTGVAFATVLSETAACVCFIAVISKRSPFVLLNVSSGINWPSIPLMLKANGDMFFRNLTLQLCLAFMTFSGLRLGEVTAATNALLMQYFVLIALGLDGVAYAIEALVGEAKGAGQNSRIKVWCKLALSWSSIMACLYAVIFALFFVPISNLMTDIHEIRSNMLFYKWYIVILPLIAHWCFTLDGIYIGLMRSRAMRNGMLLSGAIAYTPIMLLYSNINNHWLWLTFLSFLLLRGVTLGCHLYVRVWRVQER